MLDTLLGKLDNIDTTKLCAMSPEDRQFCEDLQKKYHGLADIYEKTFLEVTKFLNVDPKTTNCSWREKDGISAAVVNHEFVRDFITKVLKYFSVKYNVTLPTPEEVVNLPKKDIDLVQYRLTYQEIFEKIQQELGGLSFYDRAILELKTLFLATVGRKLSIRLNNVKLTSTCLKFESSILGEWTNFSDYIKVNWHTYDNFRERNAPINWRSSYNNPKWLLYFLRLYESFKTGAAGTFPETDRVLALIEEKVKLRNEYDARSDKLEINFFEFKRIRPYSSRTDLLFSPDKSEAKSDLEVVQAFYDKYINVEESL